MSTPPGESDGLWSRMARFVRHPASAWSETDAHADLESGYSRQVLKEMIERKRRNDFVRKREFDLLRKLRRNEPAGVREVAARPSFFQSSMPSRPDDRATTLKKIDEIEAQMSQQWWRTQHAGAPRLPGVQPTGPARSAAVDDARTLLPDDSQFSVSLPGAPTTSFSASKQSAVVVADLAHDPEVEEVAIRFANGDDAGAEAALRALLAPGGSRERHEETWLALFDLYRATGEQAPFEEAAIEFAGRFGRSAPQWMAMPASADIGDPASPAGAAALWTCPPVLGAPAVADLAARMARAAAPWRQDWSALTRLEGEALQPLAQLFSQWASQPVQLRLVGVRALERVLAQATPSGVSQTPQAWWRLRMETLRLLHRPDEFELVALDYCVTYEVSPPSWERPRCQLHAPVVERPAEGASGMQQPFGDTWFESRPATRGASGFGAPTEGLYEVHAGELAGAVRGDPAALLDAIDARVADAAVVVVCCARLARIDFEAAGALLNWATARSAEGRPVHLTEVHRLVAAFLHVIGVSAQARIVLRRD